MEIFDLIRDIKDPEHEGASERAREFSMPCTLCASTLTSSCHRADLTLEALNVLRLSNVSVDSERSRIHVFFTPTGNYKRTPWVPLR